MMLSPSPPGPRLPVGSVIRNVRLGFRRWVCPFDMIYVQHENHRYYVKVVDAKRVSHRTRHGRRVTITVLDVETRSP